MLVGRAVERSRVDRLVADVKGGRSRSLVVRGEAGIGKTALLEYAADIAAGMRVLRVVGIESEAEIPFAGLQLMLGRFADRFDGLPGPQGEALRAAFGASAASGKRWLVGAAILTLLSELAEDGPLLCLVDDVHWFDRSSIDAFVTCPANTFVHNVAVASSGTPPGLDTTPPGVAVQVLYPFNDLRSAQVFAVETTPTSVNWDVGVFVICGP